MKSKSWAKVLEGLSEIYGRDIREVMIAAADGKAIEPFSEVFEVKTNVRGHVNAESFSSLEEATDDYEDSCGLLGLVRPPIVRWRMEMPWREIDLSDARKRQADEMSDQVDRNRDAIFADPMRPDGKNDPVDDEADGDEPRRVPHVPDDIRIEMEEAHPGRLAVAMHYGGRVDLRKYPLSIFVAGGNGAAVELVET